MARKAASMSDYRELARRRVPHFLFEYVDGGSYDEVTLGRNQSDLQEIALRQRVMRDVSQLDLSTMLLGQKSRLPVALAPIGLAGLLARRGEVQAARAARDYGVPFTLSTVSACSL
jgi:L-lactate dehydrogenase (cytochrome)